MIIKAILIITASTLMAGMHITETLGYKFRELGIKENMPSLGYSIHVQTATYARLGSMISLPIMAWTIDNEIGINTLILIPILSSIIFIVFVSQIMKSKIAEKKINQTFKWLTNKYTNNNNETSINKLSSNAKIEEIELKKIRFFAIISFFFVISGTYFSYMLAAMIPKYRATIIQLAPLITSIGTFISVTYFDPKISYLNETTSDSHKITSSVLNGRLIATSIFLVATIFFYFIFT